MVILFYRLCLLWRNAHSVKILVALLKCLTKSVKHFDKYFGVQLCMYVCMVLSGKRVKDICSLRSSKILKGAEDWQRQATRGYLGTIIKGERRCEM